MKWNLSWILHSWFWYFTPSRDCTLLSGLIPVDRSKPSLILVYKQHADTAWASSGEEKTCSCWGTHEAFFQSHETEQVIKFRLPPKLNPGAKLQGLHKRADTSIAMSNYDFAKGKTQVPKMDIR